MLLISSTCLPLVGSSAMQPKRGDSSRKQQSRLPAIAPKDDQSQSSGSTRSTTLGISSVPVPSRTRLPPRSRTGCWTCRTRKVKCDEGRPTCGQCSRLGHRCDYSPRLSFRDDTPRVVERMHEISTTGNFVWDPSSPAAESSASQSASEDHLPPFAMLTTDEDRERKAEASSPGTFHVVMNPDSFSHLPEYNDDAFESTSLPVSLRRGSLASSLGRAKSDGIPVLAEGPDPNVVILSRFEDGARRSAGANKEKLSSASPTMATREFQTHLTGSTLGDEVCGGIPDTLGSMSNLSHGMSLSLSSNVQVALAEGFHGPQPHVLPEGFPEGLPDQLGDGLPEELPHGLPDPMNQYEDESQLALALPEGADLSLLNHFRTKIWTQLMQIDVNPKDSILLPPGPDVFEAEATQFPPLYHAMMALSALSLANHDGVRRLDALQHYQQAFPSLQDSLRNGQDMSSDGTFLTHFLLLVYEIAAAEPGVSNLWSSHLAQLLRITLLRRHLFGYERYPYIVWLICQIDIHASFSGSGSGDFINAVMENDMLPPPSFQLYPLGLDGSSVIYPEETDTLPILLQLNYDITVLAARLGQLARELQKEAAVPTFPEECTQKRTDTKIRQRRIFELQEAFRQLWAAPAMILIAQNVESLPSRSLEIYQQASSLYRACLIYSHTSMWPGQRMDTGPESDDEIALCATAILQTAQSIANSGNLQLRFIVFPLFMAGVGSSSGSDKMLALELMTAMEKDGVGRSTTTTRHILQVVYEQQTQRFMSQGHSLDVDWMDVMVEHGLQVVNFGI